MLANWRVGGVGRGRGEGKRGGKRRGGKRRGGVWGFEAWGKGVSWTGRYRDRYAFLWIMEIIIIIITFFGSSVFSPRNFRFDFVALLCK